MKPFIIGLILLTIFVSLESCNLRTDLFEKSNLKNSDLTVESCSPFDGAQSVPLNTKISVKFSNQMNRESVYESFHVAYNNIKLDRSGGHFEWFDNCQIFIFTPNEYFPPLIRITITLDKEAMDVEECHLLDGFSWSFTTAEEEDNTPLTATLISPDASDQAVDIYPHIIIQFNKQVLLPTVCPTFRLKSSDESDVRTTRDGIFNCDGITLAFTPIRPLKVDKDYIIEFIEFIENGNEMYLRDLSGNPLITTFESFHTTWKIIYVSPEGDDENNGFIDHPKCTIGSAIERAQELGFTDIMIANGDYHENISVIDGILLRGGFQSDWNLGDPETNIYPKYDDYTLQILGTTGCMIEGLNIYGSNGSLDINAAVLIDNRSDDICIQNCTVYSGFSSSTNYGIYVNNSKNILIYGSTVNGGDGIFSCGLYINNSDGCSILGSTLNGGSGDHSYGLYLESSNNISVSGNTIYGDSGLSSCGLHIDDSSELSVTVNTVDGGTGMDSSYGIYLVNLTGTRIISGNTIEGGGETSSGECVGIYINNTSVNVSENEISGGIGQSNIGITIDGSENFSVVEKNTSIQGGTAGEICGILATGCAKPVIRDNGLITGGVTSSNSACGIRVENCATPQIYRNTIVGGRTTSGTQNKIFGIKYESTFIPINTCNLFNNFIVGGRQNTQESDVCYGVYIENINVNIVNNTIDGGGNLNSPVYSYGIFCNDTCGGWFIDPVIINNYVLGGNGDPGYGIYLNNNSEDLSCAIFNNIFNTHSCEFYAGTGRSSISNIDALNGGIGGVLFEPDPADNIEDPNPPGAVFVNRTGSDYHIDPSATSPIRDRGYNGEAYSYIYNEEEILYDIDNMLRGTTHETDFSLIDLGADER